MFDCAVSSIFKLPEIARSHEGCVTLCVTCLPRCRVIRAMCRRAIRMRRTRRSMVVQAALNGLSTVAPRPATSRSLRVTSVRRLTSAVAASNPSMTGMGLMALMRPH